MFQKIDGLFLRAKDTFLKEDVAVQIFLSGGDDQVILIPQGPENVPFLIDDAFGAFVRFFAFSYDLFVVLPAIRSRHTGIGQAAAHRIIDVVVQGNQFQDRVEEFRTAVSVSAYAEAVRMSEVVDVAVSVGDQDLGAMADGRKRADQGD